MEKQYVLDGLHVRVGIEEGLVRIINDSALRRLLLSQPEATTPALVSRIKADYKATQGKALLITDDSFTVEIWGHLYFDYFLLKHSVLLKTILFFGLYNRLCRSCEVFDCGERGKDPNRHFWDRLAPHRNKIARWLPKIGPRL
jgi:hypothetical protein